MSLKEKLAAKRAAKEQRLAEKQFSMTGKTAEQIARAISEKRNPVNIDLIISAASMFDPNQRNEEFLNALLSKPKERLMYEMVKEHLEADCMSDLKKVGEVISPAQRLNLQSMSWDDWRAAADRAGLDEKSLKGVLQIVAVFRDSLNRKGVARRGTH